MQGKVPSSNFSFRRASSGGSISSTQSEYFNRRTGRTDFERIYFQWSNACEQEGYALPKNVVAEFKKRIGQAGKMGEKAKLNLSYSSLDDKRLVSLIECLAQKPLIAKLDLRGNDLTDESVKVLVKLLKGQLRLVKEIEKDKRLGVSFLGEVLLENNPKVTDVKVLKKVQHLCDALKYVNAHAFIRSKYLESHAPEVILSPYLIKMWFDVVGKLDHDRISKAFNNANISERSTLGYEELEKILTQGLILRGALPGLTEETFKNIRTDKSSMRNKEAATIEEDDHLFRELNSIPAHVKSQEDYQQELLQRAEIPSIIGGKDDVSLLTDLEVASSIGLDRKDSILSNEDVHAYSDSSALDLLEGSRNNVPFAMSNVNLSVPAEDLKNSTTFNTPTTAAAAAVPVLSNNQPEVDEQHDIEENENHNLSSSELIQSMLLKSASDFSIPHIESVSVTTSMDVNDAHHPGGKLRSNSQDSKHRLSDLFDEIDEVFENNDQKNLSSSGNNNKNISDQREEEGPGKELNETAVVPLGSNSGPKAPVTSTSKFIVLPRKGSNLYEDTVLDLPNSNLYFLRFSEYLSPNRFRMLKVLILRNNRISNLSSLQLFQLLPNVTDLDLAYNELHHRILDVDLPRRIQRLDLSHNELTDVSGIMSCVELRELNISHNQVKALYGLPVKLTRLDISNNKIYTVASLRSLSICCAMTVITVKGNPVMQQLLNPKVFLRSIIPNLQEIDGVKVGVGASMERKKSQESLLSKSGPVSPKLTAEEQQRNDAFRASQILAKQKVAAAASKPLLEEYAAATAASSVTGSAANKRLHPNEIDSLTKRLYAPRGSPNDPRKYGTTKISPVKNKRRRHSGDNKKNGGVPDSSTILDEWLGHASRQFDRIVKAFRTAKSYIRLERVTEKELDAFNHLLDEIQACQLVDINILLKPCLDQKYKEQSDKMADIPKMHHDLEKSVLILHQIQTILLFCCDGAINFIDGMDLIMGSKAGQYVNDHVLKLYNCYYEINFNYQDFVTRQASTRSISAEGFNFNTYDVRDEFVAENPMTDVENRRRSSMITILSKSNESAHNGSGSPSNPGMTANPMLRVRNRVMNKYLPPEVKLEMSLENNDLQFAGSNPMAKQSPANHATTANTATNGIAAARPAGLSPLQTSPVPGSSPVAAAIARINQNINKEKPPSPRSGKPPSPRAAATTAAAPAPAAVVANDTVKAVYAPASPVVVESVVNETNKAETPIEITVPAPSPSASPAPTAASLATSPANQSGSGNSNKGSPSTPTNASTPATSPLKPSASFKRSIDKLTKKLSTGSNTSNTNEVPPSPKKEESTSTTNTLSAKERLQKRLSAAKSKLDVKKTDNGTELDDNKEPKDAAIAEEKTASVTPSPTATIKRTASTESNSSPTKASSSNTATATALAVKKSPLKVQTQADATSSLPSPAKSGSPRSGQSNSKTFSPSAPAAPTSTSPRLSSSSRSPKAFTFDSNQSSPNKESTAVTSSNSNNSMNGTSNANSGADSAKLNAKERLRLRMEKNKKN